MKKILKKIFYKTGTVFILDKCAFLYAQLTYRKKNKLFKKANPSFKVPSDYFLYETYKLNYSEYKTDGELTAKEIINWAAPYLQKCESIMEWGCGVGRIIRHIPSIYACNVRVTGLDINSNMIEWNKNNIDNAEFKLISYNPPTTLAASQFDLVYAVSVFTHIEIKYQLEWIKEIWRLMNDNGIFLFSTHGKRFDDKLDEADKTILYRDGGITKNYKQKGHRMMTTYNNAENFKIILSNFFEIVDFFDGTIYSEKFGGQDLWICKKRNNIYVT